MGSKYKILLSRPPKRHILARNDVSWRTGRKNRCRGLGCRRNEESYKMLSYPERPYCRE